MDSLNANAVIKTFAGDSPFEYGNEALLFLYVWNVCDGNSKSKNVVSHSFLSLLRAFGSLYLVVPLVLGNMPGELFGNLDKYVSNFIGWWVLTFFATKISGGDTLNNKLTSFVKMVAYAIFVGNAAVTAFENGSAAFSGSVAAPLIVGYLGVMGAAIAEKGLVSAVNGNSSGEFNKDQLLAVFGPVLYCFATTGSLFGWAALAGGFVPSTVARFLIVLFRISAEHVDYNEAIHYLESIQKNISRTMEKGVKSVGKSLK